MSFVKVDGNNIVDENGRILARLLRRDYISDDPFQWVTILRKSPFIHVGVRAYMDIQKVAR